MPDIIALVSQLQRPRLLIRAARAGVVEYNRKRDLKRLTRSDTVLSPESALSVLAAEEDRLDQCRRAGDAAYSLTRHIEILIAMMAELRLVPRARQA
ncbi:MAG: hypothetical protein KDE03_09145 [Rhodobacteraceae bacterium]|nr:hypothetical protein [Paracoccaceae bacterium]